MCRLFAFRYTHVPNRVHRAVVIASEPFTYEAWDEMPERFLWKTDSDTTCTSEPF